MTTETFRIVDHEIGGGKRCFMIGEVAQAHDGSLGMAHAFIDAIAEAGADAVKFQTHIAEAESSAEEPWRIRFSLQDDSRFAYWKRMEFAEDHWRGLKKHAEQKGLVFLSTPFSRAGHLSLGTPGHAGMESCVGGAEQQDVAGAYGGHREANVPIHGMSPFSEIDSVVATLQSKSCQLRFFSVRPCIPHRRKSLV